MKKLLLISTASLCFFTASNAMDLPSTAKNEDIITVYGLLETNSSNANYPLEKNPLTDQTTVNEFLALHNRGSNYQLEIDILAAALRHGYLSMVKKILDFFGTDITHEDAEKAFPAACSCKDERTSIRMVLELFSCKKLCQAVGPVGAAFTLSCAFNGHYPTVIKMLLWNNDFAEAVDATKRFKNLIDSAYQNNLFDELFAFLRGLAGHKETSKGLSFYAINQAAIKGNVVYLKALLIPEITSQLDVQNLTTIGQAVSANKDIGDADKAAIKTTLEALAYNKGWCVFF